MNMFCGNCGRERAEETADVCLGCGTLFKKNNKDSRVKISGGVFNNDGKACNLLGWVVVGFVAILSIAAFITFFVAIGRSNAGAANAIVSLYVLAMLVCISFLKMLLAKIDCSLIKKLSYISIIVIFGTALVLGVTAVIGWVAI
ncbi:MAG: hypothetical protein FWE22_04530 [Firmicutes bacterium]|nr:hypothetical protein [Bacillota bacterium]